MLYFAALIFDRLCAVYLSVNVINGHTQQVPEHVRFGDFKWHKVVIEVDVACFFNHLLSDGMYFQYYHDDDLLTI